MIWIGIGVLAVIGIIYLVKNYISIYNKFIYWRNRAERKFADIDVLMQRRSDAIIALTQVIKKYSIHEYKTLKDTIEARSRWSKDASVNDKVAMTQDIENNFIKLQAVFEKYPKIRADHLYKQIMGDSTISHMERSLKNFRLDYNKVVQDYNERVERFPRNIVAWIHSFKKFNYLTLGNPINQGPQGQYKPKEIFND